MSEVAIRVSPPEDWRETLQPLATVFGFELSEEWLESLPDIHDADRLLTAREGEAAVGCAGCYTLRLTVPGGGEVPAAGLTWVAVLPSHRRRGILRRMMRSHLDGARLRREPVSILWASEGSIYGRFGYGVALLCGELDLERDRAVFRRPVAAPGRVRLLGQEEALRLLPGVYDRVRVETPGMLARSESWWKLRRLRDDEHTRRGAGPLQRAVLEADGRPEAYALYRLRGEWTADVPTGSVEVAEVVATSPGATQGIWKYLFDLDLVARVKATLLRADDPLLLMLTEPARLRFRLSDALWLRIVDVPAALAARTYAGEGSLVLELSDSFCPWNEGRWLLDASGPRVARTDAAPDLRLDVAELGSAYLGGFSFGRLVRAGLVEGLAEGAAGRADALFKADRAPWCPEVF